MARYGRRQPHQPIVSGLVSGSYQVAAVAPFVSTVIQAAIPDRETLGRQRRNQKPKFGPYLLNTGFVGVSTPNYTGTVIQAARTIRPKIQPRILFPPPSVAPPATPVSIPNYTGTFVLAGRKRIQQKLMPRNRLPRFAFGVSGPRQGTFVGAKLGHLTVQLTRSDTNMTIQPHRNANLTVQ